MPIDDSAEAVGSNEQLAAFIAVGDALSRGPVGAAVGVGALMVLIIVE
jgi:hypothetical protein